MDPSLLRTHQGSQHTYSSADMCSAPARRFRFGPTYLHTAVLTGLAPGGLHFYQIEGGRPVEFRAAVPTGPTHRFRFLVYGDMGESEHRAAKSPGCVGAVHAACPMGEVTKCGRAGVGGRAGGQACGRMAVGLAELLWPLNRASGSAVRRGLAACPALLCPTLGRSCLLPPPHLSPLLLQGIPHRGHAATRV